jgi:hypothetical protein
MTSFRDNSGDGPALLRLANGHIPLRKFVCARMHSWRIHISTSNFSATDKTKSDQ